MIKTHLTLTTILAIAGTACFAQGPRGPQRQNSASHTVTVMDMAKVRTVTGTVAAIHIGYGMQYPSVTVAQNMIKAAPAWFLQEQGFEIKVGDQVSISAVPSLVSNDPYLYAIDITNTASKTKVVLRDSAGIPLWSGYGGSEVHSGPSRSGAGCLDAASILTVTGVVEKVSMGVGLQMPSLVIKTSAGTWVSMKLGPERILLATDFELKAGEQVTAMYALEVCSDENVALQLTNSAGLTVALRNQDGTPNWN